MYKYHNYFEDSRLIDLLKSQHQFHLYYMAHYECEENDSNGNNSNGNKSNDNGSNGSTSNGNKRNGNKRNGKRQNKKHNSQQNANQAKPEITYLFGRKGVIKNNSITFV